MGKENKWYIVRAQSNREKSVSTRIQTELEKGDLMGKVSKVIVPMESYYYMKNDKKVKKEKVLFPGYIFVESTSPSDLKEFLRNVNGASGFLTNRSGEIQALTDKEVRRMLGIQEEIKTKDIINPFIVDEEVRIIDGPFNTMIGTIEEINGDKIKLSVSIFGRKTPLDLTLSQITRV